MEATERRQKRCAYCGRYYRPDPRVRKTQKSCSDAKCRAKRKRESQRKWAEANPEYFKGRYVHVKEWRKTHPDYQRLWRKKAREIQDEIRLVRQCGCGVYVAGGQKAVARYKIRLTHVPGCSTLDPCAGRGATPSSTTRCCMADI